MTLSTIKCLLVSSYAVDTLVTGIAYGLGLYGLLSHKVSVHQWFTYLLLGSILTRIVLAYLNILNLLVFLLKVFFINVVKGITGNFIFPTKNVHGTIVTIVIVIVVAIARQ